MKIKSISLAISVNTYFTVMYYTTLFLICSNIPPKGDKLNDFGSNTRGIGVFLLTLNWYFDRRETSPTLVCISPNRIPVKISNFVFRMGAYPLVIMSNILQLESKVRTHIHSLKFLSSTMQICDYDGPKKRKFFWCPSELNSFTP